MNPIAPLVDHVILPFLTFSYQHIYPNYGVAIIVLTMLIRILLYPLTVKQFVSMKKMQVLQPKFKAIRAKYGSEPKRMQQEIMKLYKTEKANPLGGCLPVLLQLPILISLFMAINGEKFKVLLDVVGVNKGFTPIWLPHLSMPDNFYILPVLIGVTTYLSQKMSHTSTDAMQAKLLQFIPLMMIFISWKMPSGVLLYWATSQAIAVVQQRMIQKKN